MNSYCLTILEQRDIETFNNPESESLRKSEWTQVVRIKKKQYTQRVCGVYRVYYSITCFLKDKTERYIREVGPYKCLYDNIDARHLALRAAKQEANEILVMFAEAFRSVGAKVKSPAKNKTVS